MTQAACVPSVFSGNGFLSFACFCAAEISNISNLCYLPAAKVQALFSSLFKKQNLILDLQVRQLLLLTQRPGRPCGREEHVRLETSKPQKLEPGDPSPFETPPDTVRGGLPLRRHFLLTIRRHELPALTEQPLQTMPAT